MQKLCTYVKMAKMLNDPSQYLVKSLVGNRKVFPKTLKDLKRKASTGGWHLTGSCFISAELKLFPELHDHQFDTAEDVNHVH